MLLQQPCVWLGVPYAKSKLKEKKRLDTPSYITALLMPNGKKSAVRRVWGIDLTTCWLPFFTATNTQGDTAIPADALGSPMRLAYASDGSVKFSKTGRPVTKVVKDIADNVRLVKDNFTASLLAYAEQVVADNPEGYKAQVELARVAGEPILSKDKANLDNALAKQREEALAEAVGKPSHRGKKTEPPVAEPVLA